MAEGKMATVRAAAALSGPGRVVCEVRGQRYRLDAPPLIEGPNEEVNPVEAMIASLAACAVLFLQYLARTMDVPVEDVTAEAEGDFDPRGVRGEDVESALAAVRLTYRIRPGGGATPIGRGWRSWSRRSGRDVPSTGPSPRRWTSPRRSSWFSRIFLKEKGRHWQASCQWHPLFYMSFQDRPGAL